MLLYLINVLLLLLLGFIYYYTRKKRIIKVYLIGIISLNMIILIGFRAYHIGWDTLNYVGFFESIQNYSVIEIIRSNTELEKGYMLLQLAIFKVSSSPTLLFTLVGILYIYSFSKFINKYSEEPVLSYLLFITLGFFTFGMTAIRQSIAMAIILFAIPKIINRKLLPFLIYVMIASLFHKTALIFLPAYWLFNVKITRLRLILSLTVLPLAFIFRVQIFKFVTEISGYEYGSLDQQGPIMLGTLMLLIYIGVIVLFSKLKKTDQLTKAYIIYIYIGIMLSILAFVHPAALRAAYYYILFIIMLIPSILVSIDEKKVRIVLYFASVLVLLSLYIINLISPSPFVPYDFVFRFI